MNYFMNNFTAGMLTIVDWKSYVPPSKVVTEVSRRAVSEGLSADEALTKYFNERRLGQVFMFLFALACIGLTAWLAPGSSSWMLMPVAFAPTVVLLWAKGYQVHARRWTAAL